MKNKETYCVFPQYIPDFRPMYPSRDRNSTYPSRRCQLTIHSKNTSPRYVLLDTRSVLWSRSSVRIPESWDAQESGNSQHIWSRPKQITSCRVHLSPIYQKMSSTWLPVLTRRIRTTDRKVKNRKGTIASVLDAIRLNPRRVLDLTCS